MTDLHEAQWWRTKTRPHEPLKAVMERIAKVDKERGVRLLRHARLYGNREILKLDAQNYHRQPTTDVQLKYNLVKSVVQACVAKVGKARPRPLFLTIKGDYSLQKRAKKKTQFLDGEFSRGGVYPTSTRTFRDACVFGTGLVKVFEGARREGKHGLIEYERTFPWEVKVDPVEGFYGAPRSMYQVKSVDRYVLAGTFEKSESSILNETPRAKLGASIDSVSDVVDVFEAWHLPSAPGKKDGRHVIATESVTLVDEQWKRDRFPFSVLRYEDPLAGYWGDGLAEDLVSLQYELNLSLEKMQACLHLLGVPRVFLERGSQVVDSHLNNDVGTIVEYVGTPPIFATPPSVPPELPNHIAQIKDDGFEMPGVSRMNAQSKKPPGIESGRAIRAYDDIETERFAPQARAFEAFVMDIAEQAVELVEEISERDGAYEIKAYDHRNVELLDWSDVRIDEAVYQMRVFPTSLLPTQPHARLQGAQELVETGFLSREDAMRLLDFPDLEQHTSLELAAYEIIDSIIEKAIDEGEYIGPEPYFPLEWARTRVQQAYLRGKLDGVPEERLTLLREWYDDATAILEPDEPVAPDSAPPLTDPTLSAPPDQGAIDPSMQIPPGQPLQ